MLQSVTLSFRTQRIRATPLTPCLTTRYKHPYTRNAYALQLQLSRLHSVTCHSCYVGLHSLTFHFVHSFKALSYNEQPYTRYSTCRRFLVRSTNTHAALGTSRYNMWLTSVEILSLTAAYLPALLLA